MSDTPNDATASDFSDFEQQIVEVFEQREGQGTSPPQSGGDGDEATTPPSGDDGGVEPLDFVEPVDGTDGVAGVAPDAPEIATPTAAEEGEDLTEPPEEDVERYVHQLEVWEDVPPEAMDTARAVYDWYAQLDEQAVSTIDAALSGQYTLVPTQQVQVLQENWNLIEQVRRGETPIPPSARADEYTTDTYEGEDEEVAALRQRLERMEYEQTQQQVDAQVQQSAAAIDAVYDDWKVQHPELSSTDLTQLEQRLVNSGIYGPLAAQYGDEQATVMALDQLLYADPSLREKAMAPVIDQRLQQELAAQQEQQARGQRASSISGSAPSPPGDGALNLSPDEAMVEEIRRAMQQG